MAQTSPGQISIQIPFVLILHDFDSFSCCGLAGAVIFSFFKKLDTASESIIIFKCAVGFFQSIQLINSENSNRYHYQNYKYCNFFVNYSHNKFLIICAPNISQTTAKQQWSNDNQKMQKNSPLKRNVSREILILEHTKAPERVPCYKVSQSFAISPKISKSHFYSVSFQYSDFPDYAFHILKSINLIFQVV